MSESSNDKICCVVFDVSMSSAKEAVAKMGVRGAIFRPSSAAIFVYTMNKPKMND